MTVLYIHYILTALKKLIFRKNSNFSSKTLKKYCKWTLRSTGNISHTLSSLYETQHVTWKPPHFPTLIRWARTRQTCTAHFSLLRGTLVGCSVVQFFTQNCINLSLCSGRLTPCSRVLLEQLTGLQLVKKFPAFYGTRRSITVSTSPHCMSLSWASSIQSISHVLDDTIRIGPQQAQHICSTNNIQVTKNTYITACWIRLGVNLLRT